MIKNFVLTTWIITFAMLIGILYIDRERQPLKPYEPDSAGFMIAWMFFLSSFAIFIVGLFHLIC